MKVDTFRTTLTITRPRDVVFAFFARPENLARITPPAMGFEILTPGPIAMRAGAIIDYTVQVMGVRTFWRTLIAEYDPPHRFVDVQLQGPYVYWRHTHTFAEQDSSTVMDDEVDYIVPLGLLGRAAHVLLIRRQLNRIFAFRARAIQEIFAAATNGP